MKILRLCIVCLSVLMHFTAVQGQDYKIVGTNQTIFYNTSGTISEPSTGQSFYGQDANYPGNEPSYADNGDGTVTDNVTGLMWQKSQDRNGDGTINYNDKLSYYQALDSVETCTTGGYTDWRVPTVKELYSLTMFSGAEPSPNATSPGMAVAFINTDYFDFGWGDLDAGDRIIDVQYVSSTIYVSTTMGGDKTMFGFNFADGRIKGYPTDFNPINENDSLNRFYIKYVRGSSSYGINNFTDNGDGTITDNATGLMWMKDDISDGLLWEDALSYTEDFSYAGYSDWRLPDIKELQSIVDYTRSPVTTSSPSIDPVFNCTQITNEADETDYPFYWSSTTHCSQSTSGGTKAAYISFGRAMGYMSSLGGWIDVHGAGCQRSDPKTGNPDDFPKGNGPQGDAIRIYNYVRLVRDAEATGLNEIKSEDHIKIYPNPANDIIGVNLVNIKEMGNLVIYNQLGSAIYQVNISSKNEIKIDVSDFPAGLYLMKITDRNKVCSGKFIVQ